ncbi:hypothetical protein BC828DRAFT_415465 [Blastocladiella britannica]|nr:hypothetical protein BC828DRAFT_415465 [Blastocladiella britannica]
MGIYYHGEDDDEVIEALFYESHGYTYTKAPDDQFRCASCDGIPDSAYKKRISTAVTPVMSQSGTGGTLPKLGGASSAVAPPSSSKPPVKQVNADAALLLPEPTRPGSICHTCYLRLPKTVRKSWHADDSFMRHLMQLRVVCPHHSDGCNTVMLRGKLAVHLGTDCPFSEVECVYQRFGCQVKLQRRERRGHEQMCTLARGGADAATGGADEGLAATVLPVLLRDVERLDAVAHDVQSKTTAMDAWMDEVDDALRLLAADLAALSVENGPGGGGSGGALSMASTGGVGGSASPSATARSLVDWNEAVHARTFERIVTLPAYHCTSGTTRPFVTVHADLRAASLDLLAYVLPAAAASDLFFTLAHNRRVASLAVCIDSYDVDVRGAILDWAATNRATHDLTLACDTAVGADWVAAVVAAIANAHATGLKRVSLLGSPFTLGANSPAVKDAVAAALNRGVTVAVGGPTSPPVAKAVADQVHFVGGPHSSVSPRSSRAVAQV